jgi:hypothetical protein
MLKTDSNQIAQLWDIEGQDVEEIAIRSVPTGQIIRIDTKSGNKYLFEVTDADAPRACVVRRDARPDAESGYRGERKVSALFKVGLSVVHNHAATTVVTRITLFGD